TDTVSTNTTLYARWTQLTFSFQFDAAGGSAVTSQTIAYGGKATEPNAPTREGYSFGGWYKEAALTNSWNFTTDTVTANTTLYARWTQLFTLTYSAGSNGSLSGSLSQTIASGSSGTAVTATPDTGYRFSGWSDGSTLNPRTDGNVSSAINVTANFVAKDATVLADGRYGWSENSGWLDFSPTQASATARLGKTGYLTGMIWHENIGWIKLGVSGITPPYANNAVNNWGVNLDEAGRLSGYAWSENAGWINFSATSADAVLNQTTGLMSGSAWSENLGWFKFSGSLYNVKFQVN
ncbi:MAG: InlB B-repeat-containing protein, partial [Candidatus Riflebacteria bacterium]